MGCPALGTGNTNGVIQTRDFCAHAIILLLLVKWYVHARCPKNGTGRPPTETPASLLLGSVGVHGGVRGGLFFMLKFEKISQS